MRSLLFPLFVLLILICPILWGCKKQATNTLQREANLQSLNNLRGLFALEIVMGHVVRYESTILFPLGKFMICSVAFFYFVSAFGMSVSFEKKKDYLNLRFLLSKPVYLFILSIIFFIIGGIIDFFCPNDLTYITPGIRWAFLINTNWYIWEMIGFYIMFFFVYKYVTKARILFFCVTTITLSVIMYQAGYWEAYVASTFAFPAGLLCGEYFPQVRQFLYSAKGILTTILLGVFGLSCLLVKTENLISIVFMRNSLCLAALMITFYACSSFTIGNNPVARFLCKHSTEIYLSQFVCIKLAESYKWNYMVRMPFVLITTISLGVLLHPIINALRKLLQAN